MDLVEHESAHDAHRADRRHLTLNNCGAFNVDGSAAIINHPHVAILGFGRIIDRAWVVGGELAVRKIGHVFFVFDHRICDGGTASGFMRLVADAIEQPAGAIANLSVTDLPAGQGHVLATKVRTS